MKSTTLITFLLFIVLIFSCKEEQKAYVEKASVKKSMETGKVTPVKERVFNIEDENIKVDEAIKTKEVKSQDKNPITKDKEQSAKNLKDKVDVKVEKKSRPKKNVVKSKPVPKAVKKKGKFKFKNESYDFGFVDMGEDVQYEFEFRNVGSEDININSVDASCGCTTPTFPFLPIEPGKTGKIGVYFKSKGRLGGQTATVTIYSDAEESAKEIYLKGVVRSEILKSETDTIVLDSTSN